MDKIAEAKKLLESGVLHKEDPEKAKQLEAWVQKKMSEASTPRSTGLLGDPRAATGVQAIEKADEGLASREEQAQVASTKEKLKQQEYIRQGQKRPDRTMQHPAMGEIQGIVEQAMDPAALSRAKAAKLREAAHGENERLKLKNMSKDPEFFAPPMHQSARSKLAPTITDAIPYIGHEIWEEPTIEMFRRDMAGTLKKAGLNPEKLDETDPLYLRYADAMWGKRYEKAMANDESVVRRSQMNGVGNANFFDRLPGEVDQYGMAVVKGAAQIIAGLDKGRLGGLGAELASTLTSLDGNQAAAQQSAETMRNLRDTPLGRVGEFVGMALPGGIAGGIAGKLGSFIPKMGAATNVTRGAAIGGASAGGEQLAGSVIQNLGDLSRGADPTVSTEQTFENVITMGNLGGAFGGVGTLLAEGAGGLKKKVLGGPYKQAIETMEAGGIEPQLIGFSKPATVKAAEARAIASKKDMPSQASEELGPPLARAWRDVDELGAKNELPRLKYQVDKYLQSPDGTKTVPITNTAKAVVDLLESRISSTGEELPFMLNMEKFKSVRDDLFETRIMSPHDPSFKEGLWKKLPGDAPEGMVFAGRPKALNARELLEVEEQIDKLAGFSGKELTAPQEKAYRLFARAIRTDRDKFPNNKWTRGEGGGQLQLTTADGETVTGLSALMGRFAEARRGKTNLLEAAGLKGTAPGIKSVVSEQRPLPSSFDEVRVVQKPIHDIEDLDAGRASEFYDPTGSLNISPRNAARRVVDAEHERYIEEQVKPALAGIPKDIEAVQMFSLGYDQPIRMVQRGMSPEEATRRYYKPDKADVSPDEFAKLISSAAAHIEGALAKAPKATHVPIVYRGVNLDKFQVNRMLEDGAFDNGGMVSSYTRNPVTAQSFSGGGSGVAVLFKVKHKNGVGIESLSEIPQEREVLLPGGSSFRITDVYRAQTPGSIARSHLVIEAEELAESTVGKAPKVRKAVAEGLDVDVSEGQNKQLDKLVQQFRQGVGAGRGDDAAAEMARIAGVENELKMWGAIMAAQKVGRENATHIVGGGGGIGGYLSGGLPKLGMKMTKTLNRLSAEPMAQAPRPSAELRAILKRLRGRSGPSGPPAFAVMGMASGGASPLSALFRGQEQRDSTNQLDPMTQERILGRRRGTPGGDELTAEDIGWLEKMAEAVGRGIGSKVPAPAQQVAPQAPVEEMQ